ncbi:MAG: N-acetylneuraminic acid mutarotase [Verrucomicrobiales bacterium]|jgi:N-acetylneuraminic acid mutarotase
MKFLPLFLIFALPLAADEPQQLPDLPAGITSFGAAVHSDGALYVFGGHLGKAHEYSRDDVHKPLLRLKLGDGAEAKWEELPGEEPALGPALVTHESGLIRVGGMQPKNAKGEEHDMHSIALASRFDPETNKWIGLPELPKPRSSHDAFVSGDKVYVAGGWQMRGEESSLWATTVEVLDLSTEKPAWRTLKQPFRRRALAVVATETELFCFGGLDNGGETSLEVDVLDLETEEWSKGPELPDGPVKGFGLAATTVGGEVFITGLSGEVHRLDRKAGKWVEIDKLDDGRMFARLAPVDSDTLIVVGGGTREGRALKLELVELESD